MFGTAGQRFPLSPLTKISVRKTQTLKEMDVDRKKLTLHLATKVILETIPHTVRILGTILDTEVILKTILDIVVILETILDTKVILETIFDIVVILETIPDTVRILGTILDMW